MRIPPAGKIIAKTLGTATLGLVCYDAVKRGCWKGKMDYTNGTANWMIRVNEDSQLLDNHSATRGGAKNKFDSWFIKTKIGPSMAGLVGFIKGACSSVVDNVLPFALATGALCFKKCDKFCAIGLGLYAAKYFIHDMLGVGKPHYLTNSPY